jgi:hypothetical protein
MTARTCIVVRSAMGVALCIGLLLAGNRPAHAQSVEQTETVPPPSASGAPEGTVPYQITAEPPPARPLEDESVSAEAAAATVAEGGAVPAADMRAGWYPKSGGFIVGTEDGSFTLRIGFQGGYKFDLVYRDDAFQNRVPFFVLRPILSGNLFEKWIQFWTSMELARNPVYLLDAYVEIKPWDEAGLRIGQQFTPLSRHEYYGPQQLLFPEWSPVAEYFWTGRDKGATLFGTLAKQLEYWFGVYGGSPLRQFTSIAGNYVVEGRVTYSPMGLIGLTEYPYIVPRGAPAAPFGVSFTLQGFYGKVQSAEENFNPSTFQFVATPTGKTSKTGTASADFLVQGPTFVLFAEGYYRHLDPDGADPSYKSIGVWGQAAYLLVPHSLDFGVRVNWLNASVDLDETQMFSVEGQFAYYISAPYVVLKLRFGYANQQSPGTDALGDVTLYLPPGKSYVSTLQLNAMF